MDQASGLRGLTGRGRLSGGGLRVFAFTSGKGGVGKTNLCANFAVAAARRGAANHYNTDTRLATWCCTRIYNRRFLR